MWVWNAIWIDLLKVVIKGTGSGLGYIQTWQNYQTYDKLLFSELQREFIIRSTGYGITICKKKDEYTILFLQHFYIIYCIFLELRQIIFLKEINREYKKTTLYRSHYTQFHCSFKTTKNSLKPHNKSNKSTKHVQKYLFYA